VTNKLPPFSFTRWPEINYGPGVIRGLKATLPEDLRGILWVTGGKQGSFSGYFEKFLIDFEAEIAADRIVQISTEPSPQMIDAICDRYRMADIRKVVGIGGGSVVDAAKAISAMLVTNNSLFDYLEGVGKGIPLTGQKIPFVAIPTTSGTGSEMTANAVFSEVGEHGYKKSIRHKNLVPDEIWIDPNLMTTCPPLQTVCSGLDAFTQLLEPYLSTKANPITDTLAEKGLQLIINNLEPAFGKEHDNTEVRGSLALAAAFSGTCLANAGLGIVHGLAGPLGGFFEIPHGVACAGLVAKANEVNQQALLARGEERYLRKMARIGRMFGADDGKDPPAKTATEKGVNARTLEYECQQLTDNLMRWESLFNLPEFSDYGIGESDIPKLLKSASNRNNPVELTTDEIESILRHRL
jgi:alcohol dehydrogenase class IV